MEAEINQRAGSQTSRRENSVFLILWLYFGVKTLYFAFRIKEKVFPDESSWFGICEVFSRSILPPVDSLESYHLGLITHIPKLYFMLMGKMLTLNFLPIDDLLFLRLANIGMGMLTILFAWKLVRLFSLSPAVRLLFIVMLTNTMMYTFMFGAVSYENLTSLLAVISLYYLVSFLGNRSVFNFFLFFLFLLAGALTKVTFLPYGLALFCVLLFLERKKLAVLPSTIKKRLPFSRGEVFLGVTVLCLFGAAINLYTVNKFKFGGLYLSMDKVLPIDACLKNRLFAKGYTVNQFKTGKMSLLDAQRRVLQIRDPGDRANGWNEMAEAQKEKAKKKKERMGRWQYTFEWMQYLVQRTYGVAAHIIMEKDDRLLYPNYLIFALGTLLFIGKFRDNFGRITGVMVFTSASYLLLLSQKIGYDNYLSSGFVGLALTGRYIFPIIAPLYLVLAKSLLDRMPKWWQWGIGVFVSVNFIVGEFPWFLKNVTADWYF